jgi:hypothetical protein
MKKKLKHVTEKCEVDNSTFKNENSGPKNCSGQLHPTTLSCLTETSPGENMV